MPPKQNVANPFEMLGSMLAAQASSSSININITAVNQSMQVDNKTTTVGAKAAPRAKATTKKNAAAALKADNPFDGSVAQPAGTKSSVGKAPRTKQTAKKSGPSASADPYPRAAFTTDTKEAARPPRPKAVKSEPKAEPMPTDFGMFGGQAGGSGAGAGSKPKAAKAKAAPKQVKAAPGAATPKKAKATATTTTTTTKSSESVAFSQQRSSTTTKTTSGARDNAKAAAAAKKARA